MKQSGSRMDTADGVWTLVIDLLTAFRMMLWKMMQSHCETEVQS